MRQGPVLCHRWAAICAERKRMKNNPEIGALSESMARACVLPSRAGGRTSHCWEEKAVWKGERSPSPAQMGTKPHVGRKAEDGWMGGWMDGWMDEQRGNGQGWRQSVSSHLSLPKRNHVLWGVPYKKKVIKKIKNKATYLLKPTASRCLLEPHGTGSTEKGISKAMLSPPVPQQSPAAPNAQPQSQPSAARCGGGRWGAGGGGRGKGAFLL